MQHTLAVINGMAHRTWKFCSIETRGTGLRMAHFPLVDNLSGFLRGDSADCTYQNVFTHHGLYNTAC